MFQITGDDIAELNDAQLRDLVGHLCEAELRHRKLSSAAVTWGGHQNAPDGGIDVRVALPLEVDISGFVPCPATGFQVKAQDMPASEIATEMRPGSVLRPSIAALAACGGAYIIVSAQGSTADTALMQRRNAMAKALEMSELATSIKLDFYDRNRIASWVRDHPNVILWVRETLGRPIQGWQRYGTWANPSETVEAPYLIDQGVKISPRLRATADDPLSTLAGIEAIREKLQTSGGVVRLVGLSGIGKTRLAQALFDARIGTGALDPTIVYYTNMGDAPLPPPNTLASNLSATDERAILVIDNCASDLHGRLTAIAKHPSSRLSVLTIEYDIREDQPQGTDVFEVTVAAPALIEALLLARFPTLSQLDAQKAAEFSGGNARMAIALAETAVRSGGSLGRLSDDDLFQRLFAQRHPEDQNLRSIAEACALLYSFEGEDTGPTGELVRIGALVGVSADAVYAATAALLDRGLAQRRAVWRAVLPHALANQLAAGALRRISRSRIQQSLIEGAGDRILKSFSRRLGYLDTSAEAQSWVADWFSPQGPLADVWQLDGLCQTLFENVLPTHPEAGLSAIERGIPTHDAEHPLKAERHICRALHSLAYEPMYFDRCEALLALIATCGDADSAKRAREIHASLFWIVLSGTRAPVEQRAAAARRLIHAGDADKRTLGLKAFEALLRSGHFSSSHDFSFGARPRDFGLRPQSPDEVRHWYCVGFTLVRELLQSEEYLRGQAMRILAGQFRSLWTQGDMRDELTDLTVQIITDGTFWRDGWQAVKRVLYFDEKDPTSENRMSLTVLESRLRPRNLVEEVRGRALGSSAGNYEIDDEDPNFPEKRHAEVRTLGEALARDPEALRKLLPEIVGGPGMLYPLGEGLAQGAESPRALWDALVQEVSRHPTKPPDIRVFSGMLARIKARESALAESLLEKALTDQPLAPHFPRLQSSVGIEGPGIDRLIRSLGLGFANMTTYHYLSLGRASSIATGPQLARFIGALATKPGGRGVAVDILNAQFFGDDREGLPHAPELIAAGRELIESHLSHYESVEDHAFGGVIRACLSGGEGYAIAQRVSKRLVDEVEAGRLYAYDHFELIQGLFKAQPVAALDAFVGAGETRERDIFRLVNVATNRPHPLDEVPREMLLEWADQDGLARYPAIARIVNPVKTAGDGLSWNPLVQALIQSAPNPISVAAALVARLRPDSYYGAYSSVLESNVKLLDALETNGNEYLSSYIAEQQGRLREEARLERDRERESDQLRDERFET
jgi:hypothetical protein